MKNKNPVDFKLKDNEEIFSTCGPYRLDCGAWRFVITVWMDDGSGTPGSFGEYNFDFLGRTAERDAQNFRGRLNGEPPVVELHYK